jgi:hypothetical protein
VIGLFVLVAMIAAFFAGRMAEVSTYRLPPPPPDEKPPQLPAHGGGPFRTPLPPMVATEGTLLLRDLREAVHHFQAVADETLAALDDLERETQEHADRCRS